VKGCLFGGRNINFAPSIANIIYVKKGFPIKPPFSSAIEKNFGASVQNIDFLLYTTAYNINEWVQKQQCKLNICNIVTPGIHIL
jgi:serine protease inhibitor